MWHHVGIIYSSAQPKPTMSWLIKRTCDPVAPATWGRQGMTCQRLLKSSTCPPQSWRCRPSPYFPRPSLSRRVVCYKTTRPPLLTQGHIFCAHITNSDISKATWVKGDVKPKMPKIILYLEVSTARIILQSIVMVWGIIMIFKHNHQIKGWRDMAIWPICPLPILPRSHPRTITDRWKCIYL